MMNKGVTSTVSVDSDAVCCTLLLRSDTATVSVDSAWWYVEPVVDFLSDDVVSFGALSGCT